MNYRLSIKDVFAGLNSSEYGLAQDEARKRLEQYGPNELKEKKAEPLWKIIFHQFTDPLVLILIAAAVLTTLIGHYTDSLVIIAVVVVNGTIGFTQEFRADKAMQALKKLSAQKATVIRGGKEERIDARDVVPGDVVVLSMGNRVPADMRLFEVKELNIDEAMLTGESIPDAKVTGVFDQPNLPLGDQNNMAFMGTVITQGRGKGIVTATGTKTELGKISEQVEETVKERTPLQKRLTYFTRLIGVISLLLSLIVMVIGLLKGLPLLDMLLFAISMAVAVIPEGLPIVITITMAIGLKRMADKNAIIRKLIAVETLGSCNYICSDKTGTITENRMTVTRIHANGKNFDVTGTGYAPAGELRFEGRKAPEDEDLRKVLWVGLMCNTANLFLDEEDNDWKIDGTPTEGALLVSAVKYGLDREKEGRSFKLVDDIPFSSLRKYMAMLYKNDSTYTLLVKGAPEKILQFSGNDKNQSVHDTYAEMAAAGLRVLGFGMKEIIADDPDNIDLEHESAHGLRFLGFQGIIDPPKQSAIDAIRGTHEAGIKVVMITGDNKITARAIAKQVGIYEEGDMTVTGQELDEKGEGFLNENVERISVYARVSPTHKLMIVDALQTKGHIVAVTGDGVNDAPALKKGNIGVSMGRGGTDVAREASDMVLKDDNFASIFEAVKVGRVIFDNIRKVVYFLLSSSAGIAFSIIAALLTGLPLPYLATQVLWINLVSNGLQDIALAYEPAEPDIQKKPPRNPRENIVNMNIFIRMMIVGGVLMTGTLALFWYELESGASLQYAQSTAFNTIVFFQFFQAWNSRSLDKSILKIPFFSNPFLLFSLALSVLAQITVLKYTPLQYVFGTTELSGNTWLLTIAVSFSIILVVEADKWLRNRRTES